MWNLAQQYNWVRALKPAKYMLKFRMPFYDTPIEILAEKMATEPYVADFAASGIDFLENYKNNKLEYLSGTIYLQCYAGVSSTESRLVGDGAMTVYDVADYDNAFFYYNNVERPFCLHKNKYANREIGYDYCGDCSLEAHIWDRYRAKMDPQFDVAGAVKFMAELTRRSLFSHGHGALFSKYNVKKYHTESYKYFTALRSKTDQ
jgi:hypothetical protein